jgi:pimeloyl-ACP methyl ester carboxylesterase
MAPVSYRTTSVDGFKVFYREAGSAGAPKLLLLHGFPSASHMFRDLIPLLADRFHMSRRTFLASVNPKCRCERNSDTRSTTSPA